MTQNNNEPLLDYSDVLIVPHTSTIDSRKDVNINKLYEFRWGAPILEGCGVTAANMATTGTFEMAREFQKHQMFCALHKHYTKEQLLEFLENNKKEFGNNDYIFISTGLRNEDFHKLVQVMETGLCNNICLDAPNGYIPKFKAHLHRLRFAFPKARIMAGNVVTPGRTGELIREGADIVKVGIGQGSECQTRIKTGVGKPQLSAVMDCVSAAKQNNGMVCADGGVQNPGDIAKAFGACADFVMIGGMVAGSDEASSPIVTRRFRTNEVDDNDEPIIEEKKYKLNYGMASDLAQTKHYSGIEQYRANEGIVSLVPYTGPVKGTLREIEGGLRSAMTFTDSHNLAEFQKKADFCKVNHQISRMKGSKEIE